MPVELRTVRRARLARQRGEVIERRGVLPRAVAVDLFHARVPEHGEGLVRRLLEAGAEDLDDKGGREGRRHGAGGAEGGAHVEGGRRARGVQGGLAEVALGVEVCEVGLGDALVEAYYGDNFEHGFCAAPLDGRFVCATPQVEVRPAQRPDVGSRRNLRVEAGTYDGEVAQVALAAHVGKQVLLDLDEKLRVPSSLVARERKVGRMQRLEDQSFLVVGDGPGESLFEIHNSVPCLKIEQGPLGAH